MAAGDIRVENSRARLLGTNATFPRLIGCNADGMLYTHPWSNFGITQDLTANDSDKTFTVPADHLWIINWIAVNYTSTVTAGNRDVVCNILDASANLVGRLISGGVLLANAQRFILWGGGMPDQSDASQEGQTHAIPQTFILPAGFQLRIFDLLAVDAAADDMLITIGRQEIDDT